MKRGIFILFLLGGWVLGAAEKPAKRTAANDPGSVGAICRIVGDTLTICSVEPGMRLPGDFIPKRGERVAMDVDERAPAVS